MMKFFRRYMKQLLAVFMALLLVVWLGGSALQNVLRRQATRRDEEVGVAFGETVQLGDMQLAFSEANTLEALGIRWQGAWIYALGRWNVGDVRMREQYAMQIRQTPLDAGEWYMLDAAARKDGVYVPAEAVKRFKTQLQIGGRALAAVRDRRGISLERIDRAIQSYVRVLDALDLASAGLKPSEADIQEFVRQTQEKVRISAVVLDSAKFVDETYEPGEQELQELFEQGKDRDPAPGRIREPGYRQEEAVQTEYIRISAEELAKRYQVSDEEAYEYWTDHQNEFLKPSTQPATSPAQTQPKRETPKPYETFTEAKATVIERLREDKGRAEALRLARDLIGRLWRPWADARTTQPGDYKQPPASETAADVYPELVATLEGRYPGVVTYARTGLIQADEVGWNTEIGEAKAFGGTTSPVSFRQVAFMVAGLEASREDNEDYARLFRNVYETCAEPLVDDKGNAYVFRTVATQPKQPPGSWEDVREQLVEDVRKLRGCEEAGRRAQALADEAAPVGLETALEADADLSAKLGKQALNTPEPFARKRALVWSGQTYVFPNSVPGVGGGSELIELCFSLGRRTATQTSTQPVRVKVHEQQGGRRWVVVHWHETLPVTQAEYDAQRPGAFYQLLTERRIAFLKNWFDPQQIRARVGWEDIKRERPAEAPEDQEETKPEPVSDENFDG